MSDCHCTCNVASVWAANNTKLLARRWTQQRNIYGAHHALLEEPKELEKLSKTTHNCVYKFAGITGKLTSELLMVLKHMIQVSKNRAVSYSMIQSHETPKNLLKYVHVSTLQTPSFGNCVFAFHLLLKHLRQNVISPSFCIPKVVKSATKI